MIDVWGLVGGIVGGAVGGSAISKIILDATKDRWMEKVKAHYAEDLERLKDQLQGKQKELQAQIERGTYVTQAQYDLELASYKDLWRTMSNLREQWRGLIAQFEFAIPGQANEWLEAAVKETFAKVVAANDEAVQISGQFAPFYEKGIQTASRGVTQISTMTVRQFFGMSHGEVPFSIEQISAKVLEIMQGVEALDNLIRERLSGLRLV